MGCRVEVKAWKPRTGVRLTRLCGIGEEGRGGAYATRLGAEKRAKGLRREYPVKGGFEISIVSTRDY